MTTVSSTHTHKDTIPSGGTLKLGECLMSSNGRYRLILQETDGNLVIYKSRDEVPDWSPKWFGTPANQAAWSPSPDVYKKEGDPDFSVELVMQDDGNLVLYRQGPRNNDHKLWSSATNSPDNADAYAVLQDDGVLVIVTKTGARAWLSDSWSKLPLDRWMEQLDDRLTLKDVCIPGAHDAGMYDTTHRFSFGIARTQNLNLNQQLQHGVRYFDLRPRYIEGKDKDKDKCYYVHHGPADGPKLTVILEDLKTFFDKGTQETVLVEFSHFKDWSGGDGHFIEFLERAIPEKHRLIVANGTEIAKLPLASLRGKIIVLIRNRDMYRDVVVGKHVKGVYRVDDKPEDGPNDPKVVKELLMYDKYAEESNYGVVQTDQAAKFKTFGGGPEMLFMLNWIATPTNPLVSMTEGFNRTLGVEMAMGMASNPNGLAVNIINMDYVQLSFAVPLCIAIGKIGQHRKFSTQKGSWTWSA